MTARPRTLRRRLQWAFGAMVTLSVLLFGLASITLMYSVEDGFFQAQLEEEARHQQTHRSQHGLWAAPRFANMRLVEREADFPEALQTMRREEPERVEFAMEDGRHFHLLDVRADDGSSAWLLAEVSDQLIVRPIRTQVLLLLGFCAGLLAALGLGFGAWIARRTAAPMDALSTALREGDAAGLPVSLPEVARDSEVSAVREALQTMLTRTRRFIEREQAFTRDASHELRTPLAVIRGQVEAMIAQGAADATQRERLVFLQQSALQLERTVQALLALARETPERIDHAPTALLPIIEQVVLEQAAALQEREVDVQVEISAERKLPRSATALHLLLSPLIGNAFMHTLQGRVWIGSEDGALVIRNSIPDDVAETHDAQDAGLPPARDDSPGMGLGLGLLQRLCERYRCELRFSRAAGEVIARLRVLE